MRTVRARPRGRVVAATALAVVATTALVPSSGLSAAAAETTSPAGASAPDDGGLVLPESTDLTVAGITGRRVEVDLGVPLDPQRVVVRRTAGTEPAASADAGTPVVATPTDSGTVVDTGVRPGRVYTYTAFAVGGGAASDTATLTVATPRPADQLPSYSLRPDVLMPTDAASLRVRRVDADTAVVRLDRENLDVASASAAMQDRLAGGGDVCTVGVPFLLSQEVAGDAGFWGTVSACAPGDVATVTAAPLAAVFQTFDLDAPVDPDAIDGAAMIPEATRPGRPGTAARGVVDCIEGSDNTLELGPDPDPYGHVDVGLDGLVLTWNVELGLKIVARPRVVIDGPWECEAALPGKSVPIVGGPIGLRATFQPLLRATSDGAFRYEGATWTLDAGVTTSGRVGIETCNGFPCGIAEPTFHADPYFRTDAGPNPDVSVTTETTGHTELAAGAQVSFEVGPSSPIIGATAGFVFKVLPARVVFDRVADAPEPEHCATVAFRPQLEAGLKARAFIGPVSAEKYLPLGAWDVGSGSQRVGDGCTPKADVQVVKSADTPTTIAGESTTWRLDVRNNGPQAADAVVVTDTLPAEHATATALDPACSLTARVVTCSLGQMAVGATRTLRFAAPVDAGQDRGSLIANVATVASPTRDKVPTNNTSTASTAIDTRANLSLTKTADREEYDGGDPITYTIQATNAGPSWARGVTVTDPVPADVKVTSVAPASRCGVTGQNVSCLFPDLKVGETATVTVRGTVVGDPPPAHGTTHDHLLGVDAVDGYWDLEPGETDTFSPQACPDGGTVTDVSWTVENVDQGTGTPADVVVLATGATGRSTGAVTLRNDATGRAQGHVAMTCLRPTTVSGDDHRHAVDTDSIVSRSVLLPAGRHVVTMPVGLERLAVAPGYRVHTGATRLVGSRPVGRAWELTFLTAPGGASVTTSVRPLHSRSGPAGSPTHVHDLMVHTRSQTVSAAPGRSSHDVACPTGLYQPKTIVGTFAIGEDTVLGHQPRANTGAFQLDHLGATSATATLGVVCLEERTGPMEDYVPPVVNTASVTSATVDPDTADNRASFAISVHRAVPTPGAQQSAVVLDRVRMQGRAVVARLTSERTGRAVVVARSGGRVVGRETVRLRADRRTPVTIRLSRLATKPVVVTVTMAGARDRVTLAPRPR